MKKRIAILLAAVLAAVVLFGCGSVTDSSEAGGDQKAAETEAVDTHAAESAETEEAAQAGATQTETAEATETGAEAGTEAVAAGTEEPLQIVTTIFPEYDWVQNILGDRAADAEVTMLLDSGVDLHSYQPTAADILKIADCDLFIYVGGESDEWVEDALAQATNPDMVVLNLLEILGDTVREEEVVEGMQEHDHEHDHDEAGEAEGEEHEHDEAEAAEGEEHEHDEAEAAEGEEHEHEETEAAEGEEHEHEHEEGEVEYDEHVWLSLRNASVICGAVSDALAELDPANAGEYAENLKTYQEKLDALDKKYEEAVAAAPVKTLLFGDRFPFRYLTDDYGLDYYAAFVGCSAETEASFETVLFLANKVDELSLHTVLTIEGTDHRIAETIIENTASKDQQILTMDSMQSTTSGDVENGASYLSAMEKNLEVLQSALQ